MGLAENFLQATTEKHEMKGTSLNTPKRSHLVQRGPFQGCYIDNPFTVGASPSQVNWYQKLMTREFEESKLVMSENDEAKLQTSAETVIGSNNGRRTGGASGPRRNS